MNSNLPGKAPKDQFDKLLSYMKRGTILFGLIMSIFGSAYGVVKSLIHRKDRVVPVLVTLGELIETWDSNEKAAGRGKVSVDKGTHKRDQHTNNNKKSRRRRKAKYIGSEATMPSIKTAVETPVSSAYVVAKTVILHSIEDHECVFQENSKNDSIWVPEIELLHEMSSIKTLKPDGILDRRYEYYYERKIYWGEVFIKLAKVSGMSYIEMAAYNPKLNFNDSRSIRGGETNIVLKAKTVHTVNDTDTLESISIKHKVSEEAILKANGIQKESIHSGRRLYIPYPDV